MSWWGAVPHLLLVGLPVPPTCLCLISPCPVNPQGSPCASILPESGALQAPLSQALFQAFGERGDWTQCGSRASRNCGNWGHWKVVVMFRGMISGHSWGTGKKSTVSGDTGQHWKRVVLVTGGQQEMAG